MKENDTITFLHSGDIGDIIASLGAVKEICEKEGKKAVICLDTSGGLAVNDDSLNKIIESQSSGRGLKFNDAGFSFLAPLIEAQPYVERVEKHDPLKRIDYNLNEFRRSFINPNIAIKTNQNLLFLHQVALGLDFGYKGPWLTVPKTDTKVDCVIARTSRYQSAHGIYAAWEKQLADALFIGTDFEYDLFLNCFGYRPRRQLIANALQAAMLIGSSSVFISNGTCFYWIAVGLGHENIIHELAVDIPTTFFPKGNPKIRYVQGFHFLK